MKYIIFGLFLFSLLLAGCTGEITINQDSNEKIEVDEAEKVEEIKLIECKNEDMVCFIEQMKLGNSIEMNFDVEVPVFFVMQKSKGYYTTEGCVDDVCVFEMHYTYLDVYMSGPTKDSLMNNQNMSESEIEATTNQWKTSILNTWEGKKMLCEMTSEEADIYLQEYLQSIENAKEGIYQGSTDMIGSKRCRIVEE
ncbi:MAG: hypothetical protein PHN56_03070 [Candidatus Nanoarchaeia archaeon]|nr:hypothetical protein [Candidatus Nanoarchaeia archaeon]